MSGTSCCLGSARSATADDSACQHPYAWRAPPETVPRCCTIRCTVLDPVGRIMGGPRRRVPDTQELDYLSLFPRERLGTASTGAHLYHIVRHIRGIRTRLYTIIVMTARPRYIVRHHFLFWSRDGRQTSFQLSGFFFLNFPHFRFFVSASTYSRGTAFLGSRITHFGAGGSMQRNRHRPLVLRLGVFHQVMLQAQPFGMPPTLACFSCVNDRPARCGIGYHGGKPERCGGGRLIGIHQGCDREEEHGAVISRGRRGWQENGVEDVGLFPWS